MKVTDQNSDLNGQRTHRLTTLCQIPEFVKNASDSNLYKSDSLPLRCFGDPINKLYNCQTKEATWLSTLFFLDNLNEDKYTIREAATIGARLDKFAEYFDIKNDIKELKNQFKEASTDDLFKVPNEDFALLLKTADKLERHYPIRNKNELEEAIAYLDTYKDTIPYIYRQKMASNILAKAEELNHELSDTVFLEKTAGYGICSSEDIVNLLDSRINILKKVGNTVELQTSLSEMIQTCKAAEVKDNSSLYKIANIVDSIDKDYNLHNFYDDNFKRPEDILFGTTIKIAEQLLKENCPLTTGTIYKIADFKNINLDDLEGLLGKDFADSVSIGGIATSPDKLAEIVTTLPRNDAELFDKLLSSIGIKPVAKEASDSLGFTKEQLEELALLY